MKRRISAGLLALLVSAAAADLLWQEDFSEATGTGFTGAGPSGDPGGITEWSLDVSGCTSLTPGNGSPGSYVLATSTSGGRLEAVDTDGEAVWRSRPVRIEGFRSVTLAATASETGSSVSTGKYVHLFYRLDDGPETPFSQYGFNSGNWGSAAAGQSNLTGSTVEIIARLSNPNSGDKVILDSITIHGEPAENPPPAWQVFFNLPQQSLSGTQYPAQFIIRDSLLARIGALQSGDRAVLATFTFSADEGAGAILAALAGALARGAHIALIADNEAETDIRYGDYTLRDLTTFPDNPLMLSLDDDASGIMHHKFGLFDYGDGDRRVWTGSWNFTLAASAFQWNIAVELCNGPLYETYLAEAGELLAGRFHDHPEKSHAHDNTAFRPEGASQECRVRFSPAPDGSPGGNNAESDIVRLIGEARSDIVFALNKLNRYAIRDALIAAAGRGVRIRGVLPASDTAPDGVSAALFSTLSDPAAYATTNRVQFLTPLAKADGSAADSGEPDLIHAKYMLIDPELPSATVLHGSPNWTGSGLTATAFNDENLLILHHPGIAAAFLEHFERLTATGRFAPGNSVLAAWTFDDADPVCDRGNAANATNRIGRTPDGTALSYSSGALSSTGWNSPDASAWELSLCTLRHKNLKISSRQTSTLTGPALFRLQYKTGNGDYTDVPGGEIIAGTGWGGQLFRLPLPPECENQPAIKLRWLKCGTTAVNGGSTGSTGASRIDDIRIEADAYNQPPDLKAPSSAQTLELEPLAFTVTATDPVDHDPVRLSASGLPPGAVFSGEEFRWDTPAPPGRFEVTFSATDKDGTTSHPMAITVLPRPQLLISEIADPAGSGGDGARFVELYNAGSEPVDLGSGTWFLCRQINGGSSWSEIALTGTVAAASTFTLAKDRAEFFHAYGSYPDQESTAIDGNGDDFYALFMNGARDCGIRIDSYGEENTDGTDSLWEYTDGRAMRLETVQHPRSGWSPAEWLLYQNTPPEEMSPGRHGALPVFGPLINPFVFCGDDLSLKLTAINTVSTDRINLSADALPAGALFSASGGLNRAEGLLQWSKPPAGSYPLRFAAVGVNGTNTLDLTVTVAASARMTGLFHGWSGETIFKLDNGQFWQQSAPGSKTVSPALYRPAVTITNQYGTRRLTVAGISGWIAVAPLECTESRLNSSFSGLHYSHLYRLDDGTAWEQISFENIPSATDPVLTRRWLRNGQQVLRFSDRDERVIGTCSVRPAPPDIRAAIRSRLSGWFRGWKAQRVFALEDGSCWQQISTGSSQEELWRPDATVSNRLQTGEWRLQFDGASGSAAVQPLSNVTRTAISGMFYGLHPGALFRMDDGSWRRQLSAELTACTRRNPEILLWKQNGTERMELPAEGTGADIGILAGVAESALTHPFSGLRYGRLYRLADGSDWIQLSFENSRTNLESPRAVRWLENGRMRMLFRDRNDVAAGPCAVVPAEDDSDRDGQSNLEEAAAGSDPLDTASRFELMADASGVLRWQAAENRLYTVEWTPSLAEPFQTLAGDIAAPQNSWTNPLHATAPAAFYRLRVRTAE